MVLSQSLRQSNRTSNMKLTIPPFKSMHYLHGILGCGALWVAMAILLPLALVKDESLVLCRWALLMTGFIIVPFMAVIWYGASSNRHLPERAAPARAAIPYVLSLPAPEYRSNDWAYMRAYHVLLDSSPDPFATVSVRSNDLHQLLERLTKAERKT